MVRARLPFLGIILLPLAIPASAGDDGSGPADWPGWRGPARDGLWRGVRLPEKLGKESVEARWRVPVGGGYAGIAVAGGRVFTQDRRKGPPSVERVFALDRETGNTLWTQEYPADYGDLDHGNGPRATPTIHQGRVFSLGAVGRLVCLEEATGKPLWSVDLAKTLNAKLPTWGHSASPLVAGDLLLVQAGGRPGGTLVGFDLRDGSERWRALEDRPGYSSPVLTGPAGREEVVLWTADAVHGLDPGTGKPRWEFPFKTSEYDVAIISPVFQEGQVLVSGYWDGTRAFSVGSGAPPRLTWTSRVPSCLMATPLYQDGVLYALDRKNGLLCLEWKTGKVLWSDGHRLTAKGQNPHASMVWAGGGRAAIVNAEGDLVLARLSAKGYQELGRVPIIRPTCWAHPAFSGQEVFARNDEELVCVRVKAE